MQRIGIGAGLGYSTERMSIHHYVGYNLPSKFNYRVSFINAPLRLYYHPAEWLAFDAGLQWSFIVGNVPNRLKGKANRVSLSLPIGVSFGSKHCLYIGVQPRLNHTMEDSLDGADDVDSSQLLLGIRIIL